LAPARTTARWKAILPKLYGESMTAAVFDEFAGRVESRHATTPPRIGRTEPLNQKDVILITYPDQVQVEGRPPLSVLSEFCEKYFAGIIRYLHILPFYPSSSDDGFSVLDYRAVDPALGTWDDISRLSRSFGLMVDAVLNHASVESAWFRGFLRDEPPYRDFFIERADPTGLEKVVRPRTSPLLHTLGAAPARKSVWTTFSDDQADLNYQNPRVLLEMADLLLFYASHGASIIRLDAAAYLWKQAGTTCVNLPQTHLIIQFLRAALEEAAPGVLLATETNVPHAENISYAGDGGNEANLVYNFALPPLVLHAFLTGDARILSKWVDGNAAPGRATAFLNFLASHDGIGLNAAREILGEEDLHNLIRATQDRGGYVSLHRTPDGAAEPYELNINYFDALSNPFGDEPLDLQIRRFLGAHAILLSLAGVPAIYFHSLFGSRGWRDGVQQTGRKRAVNRQKNDLAVLERELAPETGFRRQIFSGLAGLIRARAESTAFDPYGPQQIMMLGTGVFALLRTSLQTGEHVLCLQEVSGNPQSLNLDLRSFFDPSAREKGLIDLVSSRQHSFEPQNAFRLDPYQASWLTLCGNSPQSKMERAHSP
jgi:hypothetical protein